MDPELNSPSTTLFKDKRFKDSKVALYAVQDYALYYNKRVKVARRGGKHCRDHTWYVSSSDLTHLPECTSTAKPTQRQLVESSSFLKALAATPDVGTSSTDSPAGTLGQLRDLSGAQDLYDAQCRHIGEYKVRRASETVAFVTKMDKDSSARRHMDLQTSTCTCTFIGQYAIPCRHLIAVLLFCNQMDSVIERFAPGYLAENCALTFEGKTVELPLSSAISVDPVCVPSMIVPSSQGTKANANTN
ncbi:SWIM zinc finger domain-containing protein [Phytophthora infestans]|uniref:SWIM zinc finger domain-containing protein n=1 Tax=Phytophthora infestans TaxID=4787 RepID=A0A8S9U3F8_PHYIN|nr:SWIM zinc finger domain-containing protein [Phytophthora infestans]